MNQMDKIPQQFRAPGFRIGLAETPQGSLNPPVMPQQIQILRCGAFSHPLYGEFQVTPEVLLSMKRNFDARVRGIDLAVDFSHDSEGEAAAWIRDLEFSEDGRELWAKVDWTDPGKEAIAGKKFRYVSADFTFDYASNESNVSFGPTLLGAGLTNRPVIKNMSPVIELSEQGDKMKTELEQIKEKNAELEKSNLKLAEDMKKVEEDQKKMMEPLAGMAPADAAAKIKELEDKLAALVAENEDLKKKAEVMTGEKKLAEQKAEFDKLLSEGKACEAQREAFMKGDAVAFAKAAQAVKLGEHGSSTQPKDDLNGDAQDQVLKLAEAAIKEGKAKTIGDAISMVLSENIELRKKYEDQ